MARRQQERELITRMAKPDKSGNYRIMNMDIEKHARLMQDFMDGGVRVRESMKAHTTFRIGGPADIFVMPASMEDVKQSIDYARANNIFYYVMGNGSNLLAADSGIRGIVIRIGKEMSDVEFDGESVKAQAGASLSRLSRLAAECGLSGLEYGAGIPGAVGGAVVMNAGSGGQDTSQIFVSAKILNGEGKVAEVGSGDSGFAYRSSRFKHSGEIVLEASLRLRRGEPAAIKEKMRELLRKRRETMPLNFPSAGSIFKNPEGDFAGRLIEQAGCKGMRIGDAQVSDLHANWIVNLGQAKASDVLELISNVQDAAQGKFGVQLGLELSVLRENSEQNSCNANS